MTSDEAEVLRREQEFLAAWNRGDAPAAAASFGNNGVRVGAFGDVARGRSEVEAAYQKLLHGPMLGARADWEPTVRILSPDVAIASGPLTIRPAGGGQPLHGYGVDIWKKTAGTWELVEAHPKLFPPAPK